MINLEWLRTFKTIYEKGSMTAAAEVLFISQPGASLHLASLENHIGHKLFERAPRKLLPTERGKLLYNAIIDPIKRLQDVEKKFQKSSGKDIPTITVGMCFETFQISLEKYVPELPFNLILEFGEYRELLKKLEKGLIDVVVTPQKIEIRGVIYHPFSNENIILAAGNGTNINGFKTLLKKGDNDKLLEWMTYHKWYGIAGDNEHFLRFWQINFKCSPDFRPNYIVPNIHSIIRSLSRGPGLAVLPDFLCLDQIENGIIKMLWKGFKPLSNTLYFAKKKNTQYPAQIHRIEQILEKELPKVDGNP